MASHLICYGIPFIGKYPLGSNNLRIHFLKRTSKFQLNYFFFPFLANYSLKNDIKLYLKKLLLINVLMKRYSKIFLKIHRKTVVAESHFNKVLNLQNDLHNTPRRVLFFEFSENFWNSFYTKHIWRAAIYIFLCRLIFE